MLFRKITLRPSADPLPSDSLQTQWPTFAEPVGFAPPVAVEEDDDAFTLHFDVAGRGEGDLEVEIDGQTLVILGEALPRTARRARRVFALPASLDASRARLRLAPPVLEVHIVKNAASRRRAIVVRGG